MKNILKNILGHSSFSEGIAWKRCKFSSNEIIFHENDKADSLFFIEAGVLRVTSHMELNDLGNIHPGLCDLIKNDVFGEASLYQIGIRSASVIAITEGNLIEINGERLSIYLDDHPVQGYLFYKRLFEIQVERLNRANLRVKELMELASNNQ